MYKKSFLIVCLLHFVWLCMWAYVSYNIYIYIYMYVCILCICIWGLTSTIYLLSILIIRWYDEYNIPINVNFSC